MNPRPVPAILVVGGSHVHRALEQRHPGLVPKPALEQQRRVHRRGQYRPRQELGHVVQAGELLWRHLKVDLEAGVARLEHHVVVARLQLVDALDVDVKIAAP